MKTKPAKFESKLTENIKDVAPVPANPPAPVIEEKVNRMSFPLDSSGMPDWDKMHGKTKEKLKALIGGSPDSKSSTASQPIVEVFDASWTGPLYDTIGKIESFAAMKLYGFSPEVADKAFTYSQAEKDKLGGPTAKVINKYAPLWLEQFKDEIALAMLFVTITAVKFQMASMLAAQQQKSVVAPASKPQVVKNPDLSTIEKEISGVDQDGNITYKDAQKN